MKELILVNFKTYEQGTGKSAMELAKVCAEVHAGGKVDVGAAVQAVDLGSVSGLELPVWGQHVDPVVYGSHTGHVLPEAVKGYGAVGTLLNHSEHRVSEEVIKKTIARCKEAGLKVILCVETPSEAAKFGLLGPDMIAIEPPELIGGDVSVSTAKPELISDTVKALKGTDIPVLCGAGVKNGADVAKAKELGAVGILLASGVVKNEDPGKVLKEMVEAFL